MLLGAGRPLSAEYSFIAAVPIMVAATGYDMLKSRSLFTMDDLGVIASGFVGVFFSALIAIKGFVALVGRMTLVPFAVYRLILAPLVFYFMVYAKQSPYGILSDLVDICLSRHLPFLADAGILCVIQTVFFATLQLV